MANQDLPAKQSRFSQWTNSSIQNLQAEYIDCREQLSLLEKSVPADDFAKRQIIDLCKTKSDEIENAINPKSLFFGIKILRITLAWKLLHRLQEEMLLLIPKEQLRSEGLKLISVYTLSSLTDDIKKEWKAKIEESPKEPEADTRYLLKMAANIINDHVDDHFWDIFTKNWMSFIYAGLLTAVFIYFVATTNIIHPSVLNLTIIICLGAMGGWLSGIMSGEREFFVKGTFWIPTFYYALVRPMMGIFAAIIMFFLLQSQYLIGIEPPLGPDRIAKTNWATMTTTSQPVIIGTSSILVITGTLSQAVSIETQSTPDSTKASTASSTNAAIITFKVPEDMTIYFYMLLLLLAGFAGDRLLKSVSDKVMSKLFLDAEKTKNATTN